MSAAEDRLAFQLDASGYHGRYEREYRFSQARKFRFDFAFITEDRLAIEVDGGVWKGGQGRHTSGAGYTRDCEKNNLAILEGWRVLHFTPDMVTSGEAIRIIDSALNAEEPA